MGDSSSVQVGDPTIAIGNPFGLDRTLTTGVVSALQRRITGPSNQSISNVIQTDAAINPGNSGGPLLDAAGRVIGVNSQIASASGGSVGIGFAVPINTAKAVIPALRETGTVRRAWLGVHGIDIDGSLETLRLPVKTGVLVDTVDESGPAQAAGLRGGSEPASIVVGGLPVRKGGDIIVSINGNPVHGMSDVKAVIDGSEPGNEVRLEVLRGGDRQTINVPLGEKPPLAPSESQARSISGVTRVKLCGITRPEDAELGVELGAWALGFILWPPSPRAADPAVAAGIARSVRRQVNIVGVFVNPTLDEIADAADALLLSHVQLHGDEGPQFCAAVRQRTGCEVIKAIRIGAARDLLAAERYRTDFHLLDTKRDGSRGGTGKTWDWRLAQQKRSKVPRILSGGLTPENVAEAIEAVHPYAVDVASGIEREPGIKDHDLMREFIWNATPTAAR